MPNVNVRLNRDSSLAWGMYGRIEDADLIGEFVLDSTPLEDKKLKLDIKSYLDSEKEYADTFNQYKEIKLRFSDLKKQLDDLRTKMLKFKEEYYNPEKHYLSAWKVETLQYAEYTRQEKALIRIKRESGKRKTLLRKKTDKLEAKFIGNILLKNKFLHPLLEIFLKCQDRGIKVTYVKSSTRYDIYFNGFRCTIHLIFGNRLKIVKDGEVISKTYLKNNLDKFKL